MINKSASAILLIVASLAQGPSVVSDPVADFLALDPGMAGRRGDIQEVYILKADISGDGMKELFLSHQNYYIDRAGFGWHVYAPTRGGYKRIDLIRDKSDSGTRTHQGVIRLRRDAVHVGSIEGVDGTELFTYAPGGGHSGVMVGIWLRDGALEERKVREMLVGAGTPDLDEFNQLFWAQRGEIVKAKVEDLATEEQRLALIGVSIDPREPSGFVSRPLGRLDSEAENSALTAQETLAPADAPSVQAASDEEAEQPTAAAALTQSEEPESSPKSRGLVPIAIGAVGCLLAYAGYRAFSKKGRSEF